MAEKDANFECRLFTSLPTNLRTKVVDAKGQKMDVSEIDSFDLVCIQTSSNPGVIPYLVKKDNFFDLFRTVANNINLDIKAYKEGLQKRFGE